MIVRPEQFRQILGLMTRVFEFEPDSKPFKKGTLGLICEEEPLID